MTSGDLVVIGGVESLVGLEMRIGPFSTHAVGELWRGDVALVVVLDDAVVLVLAREGLGWVDAVHMRSLWRPFIDDVERL